MCAFPSCCRSTRLNSLTRFHTCRYQEQMLIALAYRETSLPRKTGSLIKLFFVCVFRKRNSERVGLEWECKIEKLNKFELLCLWYANNVGGLHYCFSLLLWSLIAVIVLVILLLNGIFVLIIVQRIKDNLGMLLSAIHSRLFSNSPLQVLEEECAKLNYKLEFENKNFLESSRIK